MVELDYAFLAEYARVDANGTLSALGASFTRIHTTELPFAHIISIAGRIRCSEDLRPTVHVLFQSPDKSTTVSAELNTTTTTGLLPYEGKVGILFSIRIMVPLLEIGLHSVDIALDGAHARTLKFEVVN